MAVHPIERIFSFQFFFLVFFNVRLLPFYDRFTSQHTILILNDIIIRVWRADDKSNLLHAQTSRAVSYSEMKLAGPGNVSYSDLQQQVSV